ncbi:hypothetical protein [Nocardia altamirensis]|uniref:hypothetical protein n=1 Tax=Nocardia altamirensis TaxID=472158 RepID=UPI00084076E3|nr:hypothetical protein [Nocardia altamirensis]
MSGELAVELRRLEKEGRTGVLRMRDGAFHLTDGAIASADCRCTTGLDRLVVAAGVANIDDWRQAEAGHPDGVLGRPRLEALALLSVFDAAYFLLGSPADVEFRPAPPHWLATVCHVTPHAIVQECVRRGDPDSGPWPAALVDRAPVVPAQRIRRKRVVLTAGQAEVLATADTRRSISGIARDLGRTTYGCLMAVRDLTTAGLIEPPPVFARPAMTVDPARAELVPSLSVAAETARPLRRRVRQPVSMPVETDPIDHHLLVRLRAALEELA